MAEEESAEGLDDLRKKRLAYFETLNQSKGNSQSQSASGEKIPYISKYNNSENDKGGTLQRLYTNGETINNKDGVQSEKSQVIHTDNFTNNSKFVAKEYEKSSAGDELAELGNSSVNNFKEKEAKEVVNMLETNAKEKHQKHYRLNQNKAPPDQLPLKTSSFYMSSPEHDSHDHVGTKSKGNRQIPNVDNKSDGLNAYNETVERLIRATKEEILGVSVSDDIWARFRKNESDGKDHETVPKRHLKQNEKKAQSDFPAQSVLNNTRTDNTVKGFRRSLSETDSHEIAQNHGNLEKGLEYKQSNVKHREHRSSFSHSNESRPMYSSSEPVQRFYHATEETRKSSNTAKIEEIFSSRQLTHSQLPNKALIQESQEFELVQEVVSDIVDKSEDMSELGLSTHRPDSERNDDVRVEADDINLGDTVTKELRNLLGEDKFNQFLMKAKRDIDELHQGSNENSARKDRTPRLLKDKPTNTTKHVTKSKEFKEDQPKSILKNRETVSNTDTTSIEKKRSFSESEEVHCNIRDSSDFTPRQTDAEAVENLIGEYMLTKDHQDKNNRLTSNPAYKVKKNVEIKKVENNTKISVPALDLEDVSKSESPRPKLNRPKYEPPTIYQDRTEKVPEHKEKYSEKDLKTSTNKNYEQITVPRNIAYSANEIYNQAYGGYFSDQVPLTSPHFHHGPVARGQFDTPPGTVYSVPLTPSTPVGSSPLAQTLTHTEQFTSQGGTFNFKEEFSSYKDFSRQHSYSSDKVLIPHPPNHQGLPANLPYSSVHTNNSDYRGCSVSNVQRFAAPVMAVTDQPLHIPHPPPMSVPFGQGLGQPNAPVPMSYAEGVPLSLPYQYPTVMDQNLATHGAGPAVFPGYHPVGAGNQPLKPHPPTSVGAQLYQQGHVIMPVAIRSREHRHSEIPSTPTTSNAEVQTDRTENGHWQTDLVENSPVEKVSVVEESAFTSVSQIVDDEKFVPHPPATKKDGGPSPRRLHHKIDISAKTENNSKRHIDGIRQHHEQRRQQYEDGKLSEEQIIERQKKFAKASLERYFSSLENIYTSSTKQEIKNKCAERTMPDIVDDDYLEEKDQTENDVTLKTHDVIDDVMSGIPMENETEEVSEQKTKTDFRPVVHGFIDFSETEDFTDKNKFSKPDVKKDHLVFHSGKNNGENDNETMVNSNANTDMTLKGGGLTERLNELGIDVTHVKHKGGDEIEKSEGKVKGEKKGKVLIVCPECQGLNKEYMSWCTQCGEMIIGVEPMLVSKNREGKLRMKPLNQEEISVHDDIRIRNPDEKDIDTKLTSNVHDVNYPQEFDVEKPFSLNLEGIKTEKNDIEDHLEMFGNKKVSPIKSDGKDSGRPSSDDPDLDLQTQKIEEEVVNDICASISDPVLKGYVRSHFTKSKQSLQDDERKMNQKNLQNDNQSVVETINVKGSIDVKGSKRCLNHDVVNIGFDADNMYIDNSNKLKTRVFDKAELKDRHKDNKDNKPGKNKTYAHEKESDKGVMFDQGETFTDKHVVHKKEWIGHENIHNIDQELEGLLEPPPLPNFSSTLPVSHNELSLKLPANSMDYSTDMSQAISHNFDNSVEVNEKGDNSTKGDEETIEEKERRKAERRKERRRKRGHGAIDVEVFGYEETRESRNSSRANRMVPLLNLAGNSSDEDDSVHSDFKPVKPDPYQEVKLSQVKASVNAWEPAVIHEETLGDEKSLPWQQKGEENVIDESSLLWRQPDSYLDEEIKHLSVDVEPGTRPGKVAGVASSPVKARPDKVTEVLDQEIQRNQSVHRDTPENDDWKHLFDQNIEVQAEEEPADVPEDDPELGNQPFLMQLINQPKPQKTKKKPKSARGKPVKSKVRQSLEEGGYQRKWARSSIAWSSYNQGELNTSTSLRSSSELTKGRPSSAPKSRSYGSTELQASVSYEDQASSNRDAREISSARGFPVKSKRPASAPKSRVTEVHTSFNSNEVASPSQGARGVSISRDVTKKNSRPTSAPKSHMFGNAVQSSITTDEEDIGDNDSRGVSPVRDMSGKLRRPVSASKSHTHNINNQASVNDEDNAPGDVVAHVPEFEDFSQPIRADLDKKTRPHGGDLKRKLPKRKNKKGGNPGDSFDLELDLVNEMVEHRLPKPSAIDRLSAKLPEPQVNQADPEHMASPKSTYDKYIEMTPRIQAGTVSRWQCLPDEILLHVFSYLDQNSLTKCAQVCQQYYRVAMDESLWKYITIKKRDIDDRCLEEISRRHPVSLALIQCHGEQVTAKGLRDLFRDCSESLRELNVARCSRGALNGDSLLLHAAARCHNLTHVDASWCSLTDSGLMAISNSCHRLESLCINGCNAVSNDGLETVIKKHGSHLRVLEMFGCFNLSPRGLRSVANNCINLITLNLGQCYKLTDSCISQLSTSLGRVESLDLRGCKQIKDNCMRRVVKNCGRLKHLSLANCPSITDVTVLEISTYLTDIRSLDLCGCKNITDGSIRALVNTCSNLRHIDISSTGCTHRSVSMIANFSGQRLETLKMNFLADVTEQSLIKLAKHCRRLTSVHMYGCPGVRNIDKVKDERPTFTIEM